MSASSLLLFLLFISAYETVLSGCQLKKFTWPVYHNNGNFLEKCYVHVYGCEGDCDNSYVHGVHRDGDFDEAAINCQWNHKPCLIQHSSTASGQLFSCNPVDSSNGQSQYDSNNPWTVNINNATSCYCGSSQNGQGDGSCPMN